jgi:toxin-antitoxin system PIN domain toxin
VILPDVNVLLYALRPDSDKHHASRKWLLSVLEGDTPYGISPQVLAGVLRIATHRRIFAKPEPLESAMAFVETVLHQPHCHVVEPGPRHWELFRALCINTKARYNLVQDAWYAALAIESNCVWITFDEDFKQFEGLRWRSPS